jgi:hypothetical protein
MPITVQPLPGAEQTAIAELAAHWRCSLAEAEERLIKMALKREPDPSIEKDGNVIFLGEQQ